MLIGGKDDKNMNVKCKLCPGGTKTLSTTKITTSNLLKHLQRQHDTVKLVKIDPSKGDPSAATNNGFSPTLPKQQKQDFSAKEHNELSNTLLW